MNTKSNLTLARKLVLLRDLFRKMNEIQNLYLELDQENPTKEDITKLKAKINCLETRCKMTLETLEDV